MRGGRTHARVRVATACAALAAASCFVTIDDSKLRAAVPSADGGADAVGDAPSAGALTYMIGYGGGADSDKAIASLEAKLGRPADVVVDGITLDGFEFGPFHASNGRPIGKVLSFDMLSMPYETAQLQDMSQAASGAYDAVYTTAARSMAAFGNPPVSVGIGPDMNGNWNPWSVYAANTHHATTANYVATFKRIAQIIRRYNPNTLVEWRVALQPHGMPWPGDSTTPLDYWVGAYDPTANPGGADVISMSFFEAQAGSDFDADIRGGAFGLDWLARFAHDNGVKIALTDVATGVASSPGAGGGCPCSNDATMMQKLVDWIDALPPGQFTHLVFAPWKPADDLLADGNAALLGVWTKSWQGTHFAGPWWRGPKVPSQP